MNAAASKKLDVEAWFPGGGAFRELVSCSNCTDYQSRRLRVKYTGGADRPKGPSYEAATPYVHMLNSTMCASTRAVCVVLENYQTDDGVVVPEVLRQYMPEKYREFIPFTKAAPVDEEAEKKKKAEEKKAAKAAAKAAKKGPAAGAAKEK